MVPLATWAVTMEALDAVAATLLLVGAFMALLAVFWFGQALGRLAVNVYLWLRWGRHRG